MVYLETEEQCHLQVLWLAAEQVTLLLQVGVVVAQYGACDIARLQLECHQAWFRNETCKVLPKVGFVQSYTFKRC